MPSADYTRAIANAFTNGMEGCSPYVYADILTEWKKRGSPLPLTVEKMKEHPHHLIFLAGTRRIHIWYNSDSQNFLSQLEGSSGGIQFNPTKKIVDVSVNEDTLSLVRKNWITNWPRTKEDRKLLKDGNKSKASEFFYYLSEMIFVDSLEATLASSEWECEE